MVSVESNDIGKKEVRTPTFDHSNHFPDIGSLIRLPKYESSNLKLKFSIQESHGRDDRRSTRMTDDGHFQRRRNHPLLSHPDVPFSLVFPCFDWLFQAKKKARNQMPTTSLLNILFLSRGTTTFITPPCLWILFSPRNKTNNAGRSIIIILARVFHCNCRLFSTTTV
jgi:hypothetical protein